MARFPNPGHGWGRGRGGGFRSKFGFLVVSPFRLRVSHYLDHATFPAPATSNAACGFPALRSPICFMSRLMRPILLGRLSALPTPSFPAEALSLLSIRTYRPRNARSDRASAGNDG